MIIVAARSLDSHNANKSCLAFNMLHQDQSLLYTIILKPLIVSILLIKKAIPGSLQQFSK